VGIRGATVVDGYENNPSANEAAFTAGWFRTGDEGMLDEDGYLFLTGRLKEQINRGGEKISPIEIDEVMLGHPAVAEAVASLHAQALRACRWRTKTDAAFIFHLHCRCRIAVDAL